MNNQSQPEIKEGLQFQLDVASDRTIFTIHSIVDGEAFIIWQKSTRMQNYLLADVKSKFLFGTWIPLSPSTPSDELQEARKEIERRTKLIKEGFIMLNQHWGKTLGQIDNDWETFKKENNL